MPGSTSATIATPTQPAIFDGGGGGGLRLRCLPEGIALPPLSGTSSTSAPRRRSRAIGGLIAALKLLLISLKEDDEVRLLPTNFFPASPREPLGGFFAFLLHLPYGPPRARLCGDL